MRFSWMLALVVPALAWHLSLLADAVPIEVMPPREQGLWQTLIMVLMALAFFYFIFWRPEQRRRKVQDEQRAGLKKGDRINAMGIVGTIVRVDDQTVIVSMYDGSKLEFLKGAITDVLPAGSTEKVPQNIEELK